MSASPAPVTESPSSYLRQLAAERRERLARMAVVREAPLPSTPTMSSVAPPIPPPSSPSQPPDPEPAIPHVLQPQPRITVSDIMVAVCKAYDISRSELLCRRRQAHLLAPRMVAMFLATRLTTLSYPEIGRRFGRDHTTVLNAERKVRNAIVDDPDFGLQMHELASGIIGGELRAPLTAPRLTRWRTWSPDENAMVKVYYLEGLRPKDIAARLGRSAGSISHKMHQLGLPGHFRDDAPRIPWTKEEVETVHALFEQGLRSKAISARINRSIYAIDHKLRVYRESKSA